MIFILRSGEISDVIVVGDVIHDLTPASRMAFSALQRAVNVRALRVKTLRKWIVRILIMLLMMISETNGPIYSCRFITRITSSKTNIFGSERKKRERLSSNRLSCTV